MEGGVGGLSRGDRSGVAIARSVPTVGSGNDGEAEMPLSGSGLTGMRSRYFWRMRSASALRFSKGCSSLNLERMEGILSGVVG